MLAKRIIPCLDVKNGKVVKGVRFRNHKVIGDVVSLAKYYSDSGADELVFYDITASSDGRTVDRTWINEVAKNINIPFCVAGGIRTIQDAKEILNAGADKISINSPALENPNLINEMVSVFGQQCIVVGIDSLREDDTYRVYQYTGSNEKIIKTTRNTIDWVKEVQERGAGEIVLNCMNNDGVKTGFDIEHLESVRKICLIPIVASGCAGCVKDFLNVFRKVNIDAALAASVFHTKAVEIADLKQYLSANKIRMRLI